MRCILFIIAILVFSSCENDLKKVKMFEKKDKKLPDQVIIDAKMVYSDSAEIVAIIYASRLEYYNIEKPYQEFPMGVKVDIYDHDSVSSNLQSNYAINYEKERIMEAKSNVIVKNIRGETLNTEHLIWDQNKKKIYSNVFVKITTATQIWMGKGFESDERFDKWELKNPTGNIYIDKSELE